MLPIPTIFVEAFASGDALALQTALTALRARSNTDRVAYDRDCRALVSYAIDNYDLVLLAQFLVLCERPLCEELTQCLNRRFDAGYYLILGYNQGEARLAAASVAA